MADRVDAYCSVAHYWEHLESVMAALPDDVRGKLYAPRPVDQEIRRLYGVQVESGTVPNSTAPLLAAGYQDLRYGRRPKVLVQHGAGQTYRLPDGSRLESPSFAGGPGHEAVDLFICPSRRVADLELARYPNASAAVVGVPKLDGWAKIPKPHNDPPVIAVTWHWNQHASAEVPEAGWAFPDWRDTIAALARTNRILGHAHPRAARELKPWWESIGVEYVPRAVDLLSRASCLVLDNSSLGFEWAALDRPTVWLRGNNWTDTPHGPPRFYAGPPVADDRPKSWLPGPELSGWALALDPVAELVDAIEMSMNRFVLARADCAQRVYDGLVDGLASERAAAAILDLMG